MSPDRSYQALLESLADGVDIDWTGIALGAGSDADRRRHRNLLLLARLAELHRTMRRRDPATHVRSTTCRASPPTPVPFVWRQLPGRGRIVSGVSGEP
jgi:hypothetical protein